ncbi:hypothetical protein PHYSODRAFT_335933 [Phytophthora sojae]|uniref:Uncharacterized protein n=1 Tax=Phytophthora sojae (strain P6497) TaxID=1094619 RepID=G4ZR65_PHYSP|nr:hypothetical protein PHYSODRAFT_335933 [Phytophthora sojae]EGZ14287.1 hypothetical protein PHYSODRAFT_335933 [Phytophthora sojae]|eukprot:XP_009531716.1 hypothetical protein PHYSODRAFT_335933 [Phytophthora sojae]
MSSSTAVQVAIGVKVYRTRRRIILMQRNADTIEMDFVAGQGEFVSFPLRALFHGVAAIPALLAEHSRAVRSIAKVEALRLRRSALERCRVGNPENLRAVSNEDDAEKCRPVVVFESITRAEFRRIIHEILVHVGGTPDKQKASLAALNILMSPM